MVLVVELLFAVRDASAIDELGKRATWTPPSSADAKAELDKWLAERNLDETTKLKIDALWPADGAPLQGSELLEQVAVTLALVDGSAREVVELCRSARSSPVPPEFAFLSDEKTPAFMRNNLRLLYGRWLAQHDLYDEALEQLSGLKPADVVDPASLLFYQSVGHHRLLDKEKCLPAVAQLLENENLIPRRYVTVARLMEADLSPLKTDSLDEVARLMDDIRRRLDLGRAGKVVRKQEEDVIAKLDKMIEELEQQRQQASSSANSGGAAPAAPMQDSNPAGLIAPGKVDPKKLDRKGSWGDLPQKDRQEALQQISRELPGHYREVIEEYFRKMARDGVR
jgi:hypothetical protein